jgi:hypothetical protein
MKYLQTATLGPNRIDRVFRYDLGNALADQCEKQLSNEIVRRLNASMTNTLNDLLYWRIFTRL